jgi:hypothetical protein
MARRPNGGRREGDAGGEGRVREGLSCLEQDGEREGRQHEHRAQSAKHWALTVLELTKLHLLEGLGVGGLEAEGVLRWR